MAHINTLKYIKKHLKIRNKEGKVVKLIPNQGQLKYYNAIKEQSEAGKPIRIIILKARQIGFSTFTEAINYKQTSTNFNFNTGIIAHVPDATNNLYSMFKRFYDEIEPNLRPSILTNNAYELEFNNADNTGLNSRIKCYTAGSKGLGRSSTFNNLHISELAFWTGDKKAALTGLLQTVPDSHNTMIVIESTANGYDYFQELWQMAVDGENDFYPLFVGWHEMESYRKTYDGFDLTSEEKKLKKAYDLDNEQLAWRRWAIKNNCGGDINLFKQEYPISPDEAFLSSGNCLFDKEIVASRINEIQKRKPIKCGFFIYDYDDTKAKNKITNIKWQNDPNGYIKLYDIPNKSYKYAVGGDTAGEGSDFYTGQVINARSGKQVAVLRKDRMDSDVYTRQMYCLGKYYRNAMIGIEANFDTFPNKEIVRIGYKNLYIREKEDTINTEVEKKFGFLTTRKTKPIIIGDLIRIVREEPELFNDIATLKEMLSFVRLENGSIGAESGKHDDLVMGIAIAYRIAQQVNLDDPPITVGQSFGFKAEEPPQDDRGTKITIV